VLWCLPVLVLWGNLHGSASLGAGLVVLRGLTALSEGRGDPRRVHRAAALIVGAPLALLVTPYGTAIVSYYRATLLSPGFRSLVTEWQPVTADVGHAVVFFLLAAAAVWALGRYTAASTWWERLAMLVLAVGAIIAVRNVVWFALATLILLPVWIDAAVRARDRPAPARPLLNGALLGAAGLAVVAAAVGALTMGGGSLTANYPPAALAAVRAGLAGHPGARVFADERYADWLLWELPGLRGRVAYDAAFELLSSQQLKAIAALKSVSGLEWPRAARGDRVLILGDSGENPNPVHAMRVREGARLLYDHDGVAVLDR
jgi:hypothetical protein